MGSGGAIAETVIAEKVDDLPGRRGRRLPPSERPTAGNGGVIGEVVIGDVPRRKLGRGRVRMVDGAEEASTMPPRPPGETEAEAYARDVTETQRGRFPVDAFAKPEPGSTPWRSKFMVSGRHSADGNDYARGDTIPEAEAIRQGVVDPMIARMANREAKANRVTCSRCGGHGRRKRTGHPAGCTCPMEKPCKTCHGWGTVDMVDGEPVALDGTPPGFDTVVPVDTTTTEEADDGSGEGNARGADGPGGPTPEGSGGGGAEGVRADG